MQRFIKFYLVCTDGASVWSCSHQTVSESITQTPAHLIQIRLTAVVHRKVHINVNKPLPTVPRRLLPLSA